MAKLVTLEANRTYATPLNAIKAVEKRFPPSGNDGLWYFIQTTRDGRYFPVFVGESAVQAGVHFHFNVIM
jgi:hypothetical protein